MPLFETQADIVIKKQNEIIKKLTSENQQLKAEVTELEKDYEKVNASLIALCESLPVRDLEQQAKGVEGLKFPTMLRKMWSGGDVQEWILEQAQTLKGKEHDG